MKNFERDMVTHKIFTTITQWTAPLILPCPLEENWDLLQTVFKS